MYQFTCLSEACEEKIIRESQSTRVESCAGGKGVAGNGQALRFHIHDFGPRREDEVL